MLELHFVDNGTFPLSSELSSPSWKQSNLTSQGGGIYVNPQDSGSSYSLTASGSIVPVNKYSYYPVLSNGSVCTVSGSCKGYRISHKLEEDPTTNISITVNS